MFSPVVQGLKSRISDLTATQRAAIIADILSFSSTSLVLAIVLWLRTTRAWDSIYRDSALLAGSVSLLTFALFQMRYCRGMSPRRSLAVVAIWLSPWVIACMRGFAWMKRDEPGVGLLTLHGLIDPPVLFVVQAAAAAAFLAGDAIARGRHSSGQPVGVRGAVAALLVTAAIPLFAAFVQLFSWLMTRGLYERVSGTHSNANLFAAYLVTVLPLAWIPLVADRQTDRATRLVTGTIIAIILIFAASRAGYVGAFVGVAVVMIYGFLRRARNAAEFARRRPLAIAFVAGGALLTVGAGVALTAADGASRSLSNIQHGMIWRSGLKVAAAYFPLGGGLDTYLMATQKLGLEAPGIHAHQLFLQFADELGLLGVCAIVYITLWVLRVIHSEFRRLSTEPHGKQRSLHEARLVLAASALAWIVSCQTDYTLWHQAVAIPLGIIIGLLHGLGQTVGKTTENGQPRLNDS
ncbi:MAG TPA: O-antigen ligase family protein [Capsulimonadaceae bacterium]|jgi:hypothetical protein